MKFEDLAKPGLLALGIAGMAGTALLGFAAGVAMARDPEGPRRAARTVVRGAAHGFERAALLAAKAREELGDLWAEAREEAVAAVDEADFGRAARRAAAGAAPQAGAGRAAEEPAAAPADDPRRAQPRRKRAPRAAAKTRSKRSEAP